MIARKTMASSQCVPLALGHKI